MTALPPDPTLDELRAALATLVAANAAFDGWSGDAVANARVAAERPVALALHEDELAVGDRVCR